MNCLTCNHKEKYHLDQRKFKTRPCIITISQIKKFGVAISTLCQCNNYKNPDRLPKKPEREKEVIDVSLKSA